MFIPVIYSINLYLDPPPILALNSITYNLSPDTIACINNGLLFNLKTFDICSATQYICFFMFSVKITGYSL